LKPVSIDTTVLQIKENPDASVIGNNPEEFLRWLGKASAIFIEGQDSSKTRAVSTLLHGNEPSGTVAVFNYLKSGQKPRVNALFIIASVEAALTEPLYSNRMLPGKRDLNRCFNAPYDDDQGLLAKQIRELIQQVRPECLIDIHNTSGSGPAFSVAIREDEDHIALTSLFTNDLILTDLRLGALMELSERDVITVTIECGGANDHSSQIIAQEGLHRYLDSENVLSNPNDDYLVNIYHNPIRLETIGEAEVAYEEHPSENAVITLSEQAEKFNYGTLTKDECVGRLGNEGMSRLTAKDHHGNERLNEYFEERDGGLYPIHPVKVFMVTTNPFIARTDCLFYFVGCSTYLPNKL
jgi:hypothetical protein